MYEFLLKSLKSGQIKEVLALALNVRTNCLYLFDLTTFYIFWAEILTIFSLHFWNILDTEILFRN